MALTPVRVETEHLGNADAYRVTREIPLPYQVLHEVTDSEDELKRTKTHETVAGKLRSQKSLPSKLVHKLNLVHKFNKWRRKVIGNPTGRGPDALNVGARGHAAQREYESHRPGDDDESPRESTDSAV